jgi:hypothetical protein
VSVLAIEREVYGLPEHGIGQGVAVEVVDASLSAFRAIVLNSKRKIQTLDGNLERPDGAQVGDFHGKTPNN